MRRLKTYHILVIIADGQVNEEKPTIEAIVEATKLPISIIVVREGGRGREGVSERRLRDGRMERGDDPNKISLKRSE